ncbi:MAG: hypothetical protein R3C30_11320 [Hyphomonadaceae bacterium]
MISRFAARLGAIGAIAALALIPSSMAQTPSCTGEALSVHFGEMCLVRNDLPPITEEDYGVVRLRFRPPEDLNDVIPSRALRGSWLERLGQRVGNQQVNSAVVLLEVRATGPGLQQVVGADGANMGVPLALVPLAVYSFENRDGVKFNSVQDFADRVIGPRVLIRQDQTIRVRVKVAFSHENPASLVASLRPFVQAAAGLGGSGWAVSAVRNDGLMQNLSSIESMLRSVNDVNGESTSWVDLDYERGANQLNYTLSFDVRQGRRSVEPRQLGNITLTLERRPSLFTTNSLPGDGRGRANPDYGTRGMWDDVASGRIWSAMIAPDVSAERYVNQEPLVGAVLRRFQSASTTLPDFEESCRQLRQVLGNFSLSAADREAILWAAYVRGGTRQHHEFRRSECISNSSRRWQMTDLRLPAAGDPPPRLPTDQEVDEWLVVLAAPALLHQNPTERTVMLNNLFRQMIVLNAAPGTLFDEPMVDAEVDRSVLIATLKPMRNVGCRFRADRQREMPRFSVLARMPDDNQLVVLTIDYGGRVSGVSRVEVQGLRISEPTDADWDALESTPGLPSRCHRANVAYAPANPPDGN